MKIIYTKDGDISFCGRDYVDMPGAEKVEDNETVLGNMGRYLRINGAFVLKPYLSVIPRVSSSKVNTPITFDVEAKDKDGALDLTCNLEAILRTSKGMSTQSFQVVNGVGSFEVSCDRPVIVAVWAHASGRYAAGNTVTFTE